MNIAHQKLHGLDSTRVLAAIEPILAAHNVEGVELLWRTDNAGRVLELTLERRDSRMPGDGITLELCSEISRELSAALDVADAIPAAYRLEVGSPGVERALYLVSDYQRFAGQKGRIKLRAPRDGERVLRGTLHGVSESGQIQLETERGLAELDFEEIESGRLVFEWGSASQKGPPKKR
jgi:ribosome maturation factor RimP